MRSIEISEKQANKRVDRVIRDIFSRMPVSAMYKAFRKRDIKVNGIRIKEDHILEAGDKLDIYIVDQILYGIPQEENFILNKGFSIVYEDTNIIIVNKEQGVPVHPDRDQDTNTLIDLVQTYLKEKGEYTSDDYGSFSPSLVHRLDRNTSGLVIIAKNAESLGILTEKIKNKEIKKYYQCLAAGKMEKESNEMKAYLLKDENQSKVFIDDNPIRGALEIITRYQVLSYEDGISRLEVELVTGRTHQIRAHLAHIGHPVIGDGKYGTNAINRPLGAKYQALCAYKLLFDFKDGGILSYLKGKKFEIAPEFNIKKH